MALRPVEFGALAAAAQADADLARNEKIVLYSAEGIHSAQAWFLLWPFRKKPLEATR